MCECGFSEQTPRLIFCTYALRLRSAPSAILLTYARCWSNQHEGGTAAKCHLWLEDETAPFSSSFGRRTRVSAELGCRGRNVEHCWYNVIKERREEQHITLLPAHDMLFVYIAVVLFITDAPLTTVKLFLTTFRKRTTLGFHSEMTNGLLRAQSRHDDEEE